ncbi:hypothetical protein ACPW7J_06915 [Ihubacter sp. rT4E-8]|uniref:hypothetical protein n=1 Tax=Ihubacter sp. rT4E-8 TaxID=3242369 RepID=UPI003CF2FDE4
MFYVVLGLVTILVGFCAYRYLQQIFTCLHLDLQESKVRAFHWLLTLVSAGICTNPMHVLALAILYTLLFASVRWNIAFIVLDFAVHMAQVERA